MFYKLSHTVKNPKGFTLVELMIVVIIIGILVAIAVPMYNSTQANAKDKTDQANQRILKGVAAQWMADQGVPTGSDVVWHDSSGNDSNGWSPYLESWPKNPKTDKYYQVTITKDTGAIAIADK